MRIVNILDKTAKDAYMFDKKSDLISFSNILLNRQGENTIKIYFEIQVLSMYVIFIFNMYTPGCYSSDITKQGKPRSKAIVCVI